MIDKVPTKKDVAKPEDDRPSLLGFLLIPQLGHSIRPMGHVATMFVRIVAMVFAMNGLFPKDHPSFKDEKIPLSLSELLRTAWNDLSFTEKGLPKVVLFFAVAAGIILLILSALTAVILGLIGNAHADTLATSSFSLSGTTASTDLATNWIDFLFNPNKSQEAMQNLTTALHQPLPSTTIQTALATALGVYSNAILVIAAVILFYHLSAMVVETAHHGVPMGKRASQIWAPIRLIVAIGLLVPINSIGLNTGQYIVIKVAKMGSALATTVWGEFVTSLAASSSKLPPLTASQDVSGLVSDMTIMYACEFSYNYYIKKQGMNLRYDYINNWYWQNSGLPYAPGSVDPKNASEVPGKYSFKNDLISGYDLCGSYTIPPAPTLSTTNHALDAASKSIYKKTIASFKSASADAAAVARKIQFGMVDFGDPPKERLDGSLTRPTAEDLNTIVDNFKGSLDRTLEDAAVDANGSLSSMMNQMSQQSKELGWIAAGAWFNQLSSAQAEINGVMSSSLPSTTPPNIEVDALETVTSGNGNSFWSAPIMSLRTSLGGLDNNKAAENSYKLTLKDLNTFGQQIGREVPATASTTSGSSKLQGGSNCAALNLFGCILSLVEVIGQRTGVWNTQSENGIGVHFLGINPLMEIAAFGHNCITMAINCFNIGLWSMIIGSVIGGGLKALTGKLTLGFGSIAIKGIASILSTVGPALAGPFLFLGVLFISMGAAIAYVVPLLPFLHFLFNSISWIGSVAEAIVGVPLVALAHLSPEGDGLPGKAKNAYEMVFSILLRPVMMVFGLICGLLILYVGAGLLNALYAFAVAGTGSASLGQGPHLVFSRIIYTVLYAFFIYTIANHAFNFIGRFPNSAMSWMAGSSLSTEKMGDPGKIEGGLAVTAGYLGSKGFEQLKPVVDGLKQLTGDAGDITTDLKMLGLQDKTKGLKSNLSDTVKEKDGEKREKARGNIHNDYQQTRQNIDTKDGIAFFDQKMAAAMEDTGVADAVAGNEMSPTLSKNYPDYVKGYNTGRSAMSHNSSGKIGSISGGNASRSNGPSAAVFQAVYDRAHFHQTTVEDYVTSPKYEQEFKDIAGIHASSPHDFMEAYRNFKP